MQGSRDRKYWLQIMQKIADPVLRSLAMETLKQKMPVESTGKGRKEYTHLEAFGRLVSGMAPWIENGPQQGDEGKLRNKYAEWIRKGIEIGTNPQSPDAMNFEKGDQPIVDAAFLAHGIIRAKNELYDQLPQDAKRNLVAAFKKTRTRKPHFSNWLLFSAMIETALLAIGED